MTDQSKPNASLRVDHLQLTNYRCFRSLEASFEPDLTVLLADNGQGKSAVLEALATALGPFVRAFDDGKDRAFAQDDIRLLRAEEGNRMEQADGGVSLQAHGVVDYEPATWERQRRGAKSRTTYKDAKVLTQWGQRLQSSVRREAESGTSGTCLPVVAFYPTDRLWNLRRLPYKKLPRTSRMVGYTHCLQSGSDFHLMADWFRYWSVNALNRRLQAEQEGTRIMPGPFDDAIEVMRKVVNVCLQPAGWTDLDFSIEREEIVARHPDYGSLPVAMLSDGIRNMLTLVADIAFRSIKLNPNLGPYAAEQAQGVVLIDEVDMHLHPAWQQTVLSSLRKAFPRIQFIVTTHSPQVVSTVHSRNVRVIGRTAEDDSVVAKPLASTYGELSSDVLQAVMLVDPQPPIAERDSLHRLTEPVDQGAYDSEEARLLFRELANAIGEKHPQLQRLTRSIERQKALAE